VKIVKFGHWM